MIPIYVASKGRPEGASFARLAEAGLGAAVFVEPQEAEAYEQLGPAFPLVVLPESERGLAYVRQAVLDQARAAGHEWVWLLDDDVRGFYRVQRGRCFACSAAEALGGAELMFRAQRAVGQAALEYQQFAWSARRGWKTDSYCDVVVALRPGLPLDFRPYAGVKVDRDYTLQVLALGYHTLRCQSYAFAAPANASNRGGLYDVYASGVEERDSRRLAELWPEVVEFRPKANGRPDARVHWRRVHAAATV